MGPFFIKDILVYWRDRKEVLVALLLPILLIFVLNIAFSSIFGVDENSMNIKVAIIQEDDSEMGYRQFEETVQGMDMLKEQKDAVLQQAAQLSPSEIIVSFIKSSELNEWVQSQELSELEAVSLVEKGELDAIIRIPKGFNYGVLSSIFLRESSDTSLLIQSEEESSEVNTLQMIVDNFLHGLNYQFALETVAEGGGVLHELPQGGREVMEGVESYTMLQYFTIAMSTLFPLFLSSTLAIKAFTEKREHVFRRILLSNSHPTYYLIGKTLAAFCLSWVQIMVTIGISQLILDVFPEKPIDFWLGLTVVMTAYALTIAGLTALFTSITLNSNDVNLANGIMTVVVIGFGMLGGGFFPLHGLPESLQIVSAWIPNGVTQIALTEWIQLGQPQNLIQPLLFLIGLLVVFLVIGISIFPKRGQSS